MRRFAAQYIICATGEILKRGIISCDDSGTITEITDTSGDFKESASTPFYNGIIVPGFINCHSHIELSDMLGVVPGGSGLGNFVREVSNKRNPSKEKALEAIKQADQDIFRSGTSAVADICNSSLSFSIKDESPVTYINLLEVFGIDPAKAKQRIDSILSLKKEADRFSSQSYIVPHSVYSLSKPLFLQLSEIIATNDITSIHFMESLQEARLIEKLEGDLLESYKRMGIDRGMLEQRVSGHLEAIQDYLPGGGNLVLVHNTVLDNKSLESLKRDNLFWCLCPKSNLYIEDTLPPVEEIRSAGETIVLGTDSLASNNSLNLLEEIKCIQENFPDIPLAEIIEWASANGAKALNLDKLGTIEVGKSPGLVLLENCDLENIRLLPESRSLRLI